MGRITEDGLIPPKRKKGSIDSVTVKEFGASNSTVELGSDIYDALKKHFPKIYLQSQYSVEAWAFLNQLSLMLVYRIYSLLHEKDLTKKYSVSDYLNYLKYIRKSKINNVWYTGEITKATQTLLDKLEIHIT